MKRDDLLFFVEEFRDGLLGERSSDMMCGAVSMPLQALLYLYGVKTELMQGLYESGDRNHLWLECEDGTVIDPTADQFGGPKVYIGPVTGIYTAGRTWA